MKRYFGLLSALLLIAGLGVVSVYGHAGPGKSRAMMRHHSGMALPMLLRGVELTADQKTQVRDIMANHRASFRELLGQLRSVQNEIENKILSPDNVEAADLTAQIQQLSQLHSQLADENLKVTLEIRKLLTPEQLAQAAQHKEQMQARWAEMRERFRQKRAEEKNQ
jgi:Spy/CpxP family protein refolding chaperone